MKRLLLIFALMVLLAAPALAQGPACPVAITDVRSLSGNVKVLFRNISPAEITEYDFIVWFADFDEQLHFLPALVPDSEYRRIKAGRGAVVVYPAPETLDYTFSQVNAYVLRVAFADGNVWNDDGSHSCSLTALQE
ncbi:MAG TPA: hypothetical protein VF532_08965 [Candidatus Angelobacter sp.]